MKNKSASGEFEFSGALTIVFIVLKLCKVITWSWFWVLSPIWISVILTIILLAIIMIIYGGKK